MSATRYPGAIPRATPVVWVWFDSGLRHEGKQDSRFQKCRVASAEAAADTNLYAPTRFRLVVCGKSVLLRADLTVGAVREEVAPFGAREVATGDPTRETYPGPQIRRPQGGVCDVVDHQVSVRRDPGDGDRSLFDGEGVTETFAGSHVPQRGGTSLDDQSVQVFHIRGGKVTESWINPTDQTATDDFWS